VRVLVIEDERLLADQVAAGLRDQGMVAHVACDGRAGLEMAYATPYDVVVLDRDLPVVSGDQVCRQLVADRGLTSRILMLTASGGVEQRVEGLSMGADDYLPKPFHFSELVARVHALARRAPALPPVLRLADLEVDTLRRTVTRAGLPLSLRRKEFEVLALLMRAEGSVVGTPELLEGAWEESAWATAHTLRMTVARLRQKLGPPSLIDTVPGVGYRIAGT
jgi:DNA-binding response OmpR family regulator